MNDLPDGKLRFIYHPKSFSQTYILDKRSQSDSIFLAEDPVQIISVVVKMSGNICGGCSGIMSQDIRIDTAGQGAVWGNLMPHLANMKILFQYMTYPLRRNGVWQSFAWAPAVQL